MQNLVFDLDGTLIDVSRRDYQLYITGMLDIREDALDFETYWSLRRQAMSMLDIFRRHGIPEHALQYYLIARDARAEHVDFLVHDAVLENTHRVLSECCQRYECHLLSARHNEINMHAQIDRLDLSKYFKSAQLTKGPKLEALSRMQNVCAVIGDSEYDINPAKSLGLRSIAVTTGYRSREFLEALVPDHVFDDIGDVLSVL